MDSLDELDYSRLIREARDVPAPHGNATRIALLGNCALQPVQPLLRAVGHRAGLSLRIHEAAFDASALEALDPSSELHAFQPQFCVVLDAVQGLRDRFYCRSSDPAEFIRDTIQRITTVWDAVLERSRARIIQCNFAIPFERFFGNYDLKRRESLRSIVCAINAGLVDEARLRDNVLLLDIEYLAASYGTEAWFDERFWTIAKSFCAPRLLPLVANAVVEILRASLGAGIKCIAVDLDNTLWGGVVGDDGPLGIRVADHGDGEEFFRVQQFLKELNRRGVLLAACSKNEDTNARSAFVENPGMCLKVDDFAAFVANWNNKAENLHVIRDTLNIGFDSIVFLDDNPFERNLVRSMVPQVLVPELPEDPSEYVRALSKLNLFEVATHAAEDAERTEFYRREAQRRDAQHAAASFTEFLQALEMKIDVRRFAEEHMPRIVQLFQRSNQYNLTTRRRSQAECAALAADPMCLALQASLSDKFGSHGLIAVVVAQPANDVLRITDWLMSCRVLTRGVEQYLMNVVVEHAKTCGLRMVEGEYIPTPKNGMVKGFFEQFGFTKTRETEDGATSWKLDVDQYVARTVFISAADALESVE